MDDGDSTTVHEAVTSLQNMMAASKGAVRNCKVLTMEAFLLLLLARVERNGEDKQKAKTDLSSLVLKYEILFGQNPVGITESDVHPVLWAEAVKFKV